MTRVFPLQSPDSQWWMERRTSFSYLSKSTDTRAINVPLHPPLPKSLNLLEKKCLNSIEIRDVNEITTSK